MSRPFVIGLTGSIGMGKSTTSEMFKDAGIPVWSADEAVHRLYEPGGAGSNALKALVPDAVGAEGVDRKLLSVAIAENPDLLSSIEAVIHPLVASDRARFLSTCESPIAVVDIPLLFETGAENQVDLVAVVSVDTEIQRQRVLARPGMTDSKLDFILSKQVPDDEKRRRADIVIDTSTLEAARRGVQDVIDRARGQSSDA